MKKSLFILCLLLLIAVLPFTAAATSSRVDDKAGLLTSSEESRIEALLDQISEQYNVDIVIATVDYISGFSIDTYTENYYDSNNIGVGSRRSGALLLVSMDEREYRILTDGMAGDAMDGRAIDRIGDKITDDLSSGNYEEAFRIFARQCEYYLSGYETGFPFPVWDNLKICVIVGAVIAVIAVIVMCLQLKSVRKQLGAGAYTRPGSMQVTQCSDIFLYRNVTRVRIQTNSSGGRSGGGGGSRHMGGGKF